MRTHERIRGLLRSPWLAWDILFHGRYRFIYDRMPLYTFKMPMPKRLNLLKAGKNLLYRRLTPWNMPLHMQFELTNFCNLRCPVCPTGISALKRKPGAMDPSLFERVMDEVGPFLLTVSLWAWGEPLLHPRLEKILEAAGKHRFISLLSTNGQNLDEERVVNALIKHPPTHLIVALDGLCDETNSRFRQGAKIAPALAGVRRIARIKKENGLKLPILHMRFIVMNHNQHEVPRVKAFAEQHHFDMLSVRTLSIIDENHAEKVHGNLVPDDKSFKAYAYHEGRRIQRKDFICQEPFWFPTVFSDGTLVACEQDFNAQLAMGSLAEGKAFKDIWFSRHAAGIRKIIRDGWEKVSFCRNCPYRDRETTDVSIEAHFWRETGMYPGMMLPPDDAPERFIHVRD